MLAPIIKTNIKIRQPDFNFDSNIPRYWFNSNPVITHNFNGYNLLFPEFELFFVRSVLYYKNKIEDEKLLQQVKGFVGQESMHAKVHQEYFEVLRKQGYRIDKFLRLYKRYANFVERMATPKLRIALTAAAEHYTATIAGLLVSSPELLKDVDPVMKKLMVWHSTEEIEHRSVAYDVMLLAEVSYPLRILAFLMTSFDMLLWSTLSSLLFLRQDKISLFTSFKFKRQFHKQNPTANKRFRRSLLSYFKRDFHPRDNDYLEQAKQQLKAVGIDD
ncbi:MAG: metal-dependent hydrolase [Cocleimonas sp.]